MAPLADSVTIVLYWRPLADVFFKKQLPSLQIVIFSERFVDHLAFSNVMPCSIKDC